MATQNYTWRSQKLQPEPINGFLCTALCQCMKVCIVTDHTECIDRLSSLQRANCSSLFSDKYNPVKQQKLTSVEVWEAKDFLACLPMSRILMQKSIHHLFQLCHTTSTTESSIFCV